MNENIDFIILEHDDGAGCALIAATVEGAVPAIDGYNTPYIVAEGYDHAARDWEDCRLFDDIGKAKLAYEKLRGRDYSLDADIPDSIAFRAKHSDIGTDDYRARPFRRPRGRPGPPRGQRLCGERRRGRIRPHVAGGGIVQAFRAGLGSGWRTRS